MVLNGSWEVFGDRRMGAWMQRGFLSTLVTVKEN